jgi:hypothetical protein
MDNQESETLIIVSLDLKTNEHFIDALVFQIAELGRIHVNCLVFHEGIELYFPNFAGLLFYG